MPNVVSAVEEFKNNIRAVFELKDLREINHLLSIRINRNNDGSIILNQNAYATEILQITGMLKEHEHL